MNDLISRAAAIKAFTGKPPEYYHTNYIVGELNDIPAVDAVPVVRCKECVFWLRDEGHGSSGECECGCNDGWWLPEDYCSCGERRDNDASN